MDKPILEIEDIKRILPQRYPFLMIDRVIEYGKDKVVAIKNVSVNEEYFKGHFPDNPITPGVLIIEAMAQTGLVLYRKVFNNNKLVYLGSVKAKILEPVRPGDVLTIESTPKKMFSKIGVIDIRVFVNNKVVAEMEMGYGTEK
jgi:beta-hydroxyacyl-ACP dehydratase FabZ